MSRIKIPKKTGIQWVSWILGELKNLVKNVDQVAADVWAAIYLVFQKGVREGKAIRVLVDDEVVATVVATRKFLRYLGTEVIPDLPVADIRGFFKTRSGLWVSDDFKNLVLKHAQSESACSGFSQDRLELKKPADGFQIRDDLQGGIFRDVNYFCRYLMYLLEQQKGGKAGTLLNNGRANLFVIEVNGLPVVVHVHWRSVLREWLVRAYPPGLPWDAGNQVLAPATAT